MRAVTLDIYPPLSHQLCDSESEPYRVNASVGPGETLESVVVKLAMCDPEGWAAVYDLEQGCFVRGLLLVVNGTVLSHDEAAIVELSANDEIEICFMFMGG